MKSSVAIYEPIYAGNPEISSNRFLPWNIGDNSNSSWREFKILVDMYRAGIYKNSEFTGLFSPKFALKTKIFPADFIDFVQTHNDSDVVFINPFPQIRYWSYNVWMQGGHAHPGLVPVAQSLLDAVGIECDLQKVPRHGLSSLCYCNFWVGNQRFWENYVGKVLLPIAEFLETNPEHPAAQAVMRTTQHTDPAPFLPFIIERMFSTFLSTNGSINACAYPIDGDDVLKYCLDDFERILLRNLQAKIDKADETGSFDDALIGFMNFMGELFQQHHYEYYANALHPHSGRIVDRLDGGKKE
jgi:hypothetical protein